MVNFTFACAVLLSMVLLGGCADKYNDESRPYEFGFNIEGEQHRHEMKDKNGIIMGEFGFLTADGVYHVTVYATDENGNFKILSMKNIRVKPFPTAVATSPAPPTRLTSQALQLPPRGNAIAQSPIKPNLAQSCAHCSLPPSTQSSQQLPQIQSGPSNSGQPHLMQGSQLGQGPQFGQGQFNQNQDLENTEVFTQNGGQPFGGNYDNKQTPSRQKQRLNQGGVGNQGSNYIGSSPQQQNQGSKGNALTFSGNGNNPEKPILISANMKIVERPGDLNEKAPGEKDGLPAGLSTGDMLELLYTFNYTLGFHGHHEVGYRNGFKKGYYFVTGRDGVKTKVEYEADAQGYRPRIINEKFGLESPEVPKAETEKGDKYGLKGYEFKWLYFPKEEANKRFR